MVIETPMQSGQITYLSNHPALAPLFRHFKNFAKNGLAEFSAGKVCFSASAIETYSADVFEKVGEIDNAIAALRMAVGFILDLSSSSDIGSDVYRYHYENYLLRSVGVVDRAHRLVGAGLQLDAEKYKRSSGNQYVQDQVKNNYPDILAALNAVNICVQKNRSPRNELIHSSAFSNRELGLFSAIETIGIQQGSDMNVKELMCDHFSETSVEISKVIFDLVTALFELISALSKVFLDVVNACE